MAQENFTIPNNPTYTRNLRKMLTSDPVHADVVNEWLQPVINNVHHNHLAIDASRTSIGANEVAIEANRTSIGANQTAIGANTTAIANNRAAIGVNTTAIGANEVAIAANRTSIGANATAIAENRTSIGANTTAIANNRAAIEQTNTRIDLLEDTVEDSAADLNDGLSAVNERIDGIRQLPAGGSTNQVLFGGGMGWRSLSQTRDLTLVDDGESINSVDTSFAWLDEQQSNWGRLDSNLPERFNELITFAVMGGEFWNDELENEPAQIRFQGSNATLTVQARLAHEDESIHLSAEKTLGSATTNYRYNSELESWQRNVGNNEWVELESEYELSITARSVSLIRSELAHWNAVVAQQTVYQPGLHAHTHEGWQPVVSDSGGQGTTCSGGGATNARLLTEGVDYTVDTENIEEHVSYGPMTMSNILNLWNEAGAFNFNAFTTVGRVAFRSVQFWPQNYGRRRIYPEDLADMFAIRLVPNAGQALNLTVTDIENIYCMDNSTIRTTIVTATGDFPGISFQLQTAIGYNLEDSNITAYMDQIYFKLTVTNFNPALFSNSLTINRIEFSLPAIQRTYVREFGAFIRLNEDFDTPEQLSAKIRLSYSQENIQRDGTATISSSINPRTMQQIAGVAALDDRIEFCPEISLSTILGLKDLSTMGIYLEYVKIAQARNVFFLFTNWNWNGRVVGFEVLELWKKFEQSGR